MHLNHREIPLAVSGKYRRRPSLDAVTSPLTFLDGREVANRPSLAIELKAVRRGTDEKYDKEDGPLQCFCVVRSARESVASIFRPRSTGPLGVWEFISPQRVDYLIQ